MTVLSKQAESKSGDKAKVTQSGDKVKRLTEAGHKVGPSAAKRPKLQYRYDPSGVIDLSAKVDNKSIVSISADDNGTLDLSVKRHSPSVQAFVVDTEQPLDFSCHVVQQQSAVSATTGVVQQQSAVSATTSVVQQQSAVSATIGVGLIPPVRAVHIQPVSILPAPSINNITRWANVDCLAGL